ncbi:MAG TPA: acyltransferase [Spirochaetota bacterium]|nr:acyltransferase [Spirochaetota bacterium]
MDELIVKQSNTGHSFRFHKSSYVEDGALIGDEVKIWRFSHIMKGAQIGKGSSLGQNVFVSSKAKIGEKVKIQNNVSIYDDVIIEDEVFIGPSVVFTNVLNPRAFIERKSEYKKTLIKRGASIGANATIVCGITIGKYALVGAGSVVTKNIPNYSLFYGNPAVFKGFICFCGEKLDKSLKCDSCGKKYRYKDDGEIEEILETQSG